MKREEIWRDREAFKLAREYLLARDGVTQEMIKKQMRPELHQPDNLALIYERILESARNRGMSPNVLGQVSTLGRVLCGFEPSQIVAKYGDDQERLCKEVGTHWKPGSKFREERGSIFPLFCRTITSAAAFMAQFKTARDFYCFVDVFDRDDRLRPALPMLLSHEIDGFGFALACDFLKEISYVKFGKPDVHVKTIFKGLELCRFDDDYRVFKAIVRVALNADDTPYAVDKLFWLVGSGNFDGVKVKTNREEFINNARRRLAV